MSPQKQKQIPPTIIKGTSTQNHVRLVQKVSLQIAKIADITNAISVIKASPFIQISN